MVVIVAVVIRILCQALLRPLACCPPRLLPGLLLRCKLFVLELLGRHSKWIQALFHALIPLLPTLDLRPPAAFDRLFQGLQVSANFDTLCTLEGSIPGLFVLYIDSLVDVALLLELPDFILQSHGLLDEDFWPLPLFYILLSTKRDVGK